MKEISAPLIATAGAGMPVGTFNGEMTIAGHNPVIVSSGYGALIKVDGGSEIHAAFGVRWKGYVHRLTWTVTCYGVVVMNRPGLPRMIVRAGNAPDEFPDTGERIWQGGCFITAPVAAAAAWHRIAPIVPAETRVYNCLAVAGAFAWLNQPSRFDPTGRPGVGDQAAAHYLPLDVVGDLGQLAAPTVDISVLRQAGAGNGILSFLSRW